jgi:hypothetical protein
MGQHVRNHFIINFVKIVPRHIEKPGRIEAKARIDVPINFGVRGT